MSSERKTMWVVVILALAMVLWYRVRVFSEPASPPAPNLVFVTGGSGPYWQATIDGARAAAKTLHANLDIESPEKSENLDEQMGILRRLDRTVVQGIAISPLDAERQTHEINDLCTSLKVVTFDSDAPLSNRHNHVGTSNFAAGKTCARMVNECLPEGGEIAILLANSTKANLIERKAGFQEQIERLADDVEEGQQTPKFTIVGFFEDNGNDDLCRENIGNIFAEHPEVACIVALNARQGSVLLKELEKLGKLDQVKLVTFDTSEETLAGIEAGHVFATIAQDPYRFGYEAVDMLIRLCQGEETSLPIVGHGSVYVGVEAIRKENVEQFRERLQSRQKKSDKQTSTATNTKKTTA